MSILDFRKYLIPAMEAGRNAANKTDTPRAVSAESNPRNNPLAQVTGLTSGLRENDDEEDTAGGATADNTPEENDPQEDTASTGTAGGNTVDGIDTTPAGGDEADSDNTSDEDDSGDANAEDGSSDMDEPKEQATYMDKNVLRDNMICFYNILGSNIDSLSNVNSDINDPVSIQVLNKVIDNLTMTQAKLYDVITKDLEKETYPKLALEYISLKRIYDLTIEMLEKHFTNISPKNHKKRSSKKS